MGKKKGLWKVKKLLWGCFRDYWMVVCGEKKSGGVLFEEKKNED